MSPPPPTNVSRVSNDHTVSSASFSYSVSNVCPLAKDHNHDSMQLLALLDGKSNQSLFLIKTNCFARLS